MTDIIVNIIPKDLGKEFPSVLDNAYAQYKRDLACYRIVEEIMIREVVDRSWARNGSAASSSPVKERLWAFSPNEIRPLRSWRRVSR